MQYLIRQSFEGYGCDSELKLCLSVTLIISIDSTLIILLCKFVNFGEMKKEIYKMIFLKQIMKKL